MSDQDDFLAYNAAMFADYTKWLDKRNWEREPMELVHDAYLNAWEAGRRWGDEYRRRKLQGEPTPSPPHPQAPSR